MSSTPEAGLSSRRGSPAELSGSALTHFIWTTKYQSPGEAGIADSWRRIARAAASIEAEAESWEARFLEALEDFRFLPGGRIQAGAGRPGSVLFNCFVLPGPGPDPDLALAALRQSVATLRAGGGVGIDLSNAPPRGWPRSDGPPSPNPIGYLELWDAACRVFLSDAARQGAMMGVLRCDHPAIEMFAAAKQPPGVLPRFNLSVAVTDEFMAAVRADGPWALRFPPDSPVAIARQPSARALWHLILRSAYACGEPGVLFIDRINAENNLWWREALAATNPCGEIPLPDYGACALGSLNLTRFVHDPFTPRAKLDAEALASTAAVAVRLLDNVIDISDCPLPDQASAVKATRRIGLGITGLADALLMLGLRYGEAGSLRWAGEAMRTVRDAAYRVSCGLAREKGAFPLFDPDRYLQGPFIRRLPAALRRSIAEHGIRNSHLLAIAPAGSISLLAGGVSSGLEPIFAREQVRPVRDRSGQVQEIRFLDPAVSRWREPDGESRGDPPGFVAAHELSPTAHLDMQAALQPFVDNAISKTVNVPADIGFDAFQAIYDEAYDRGLKGCTVFRAGEPSLLAVGKAVCPSSH
jgi:ribonucleoside-diphosphate reductase alpha chain